MATPLIRVYEYMDDDGNTYWSFIKHQSTISPPKRLVLQNRMGTILGHFLVKLRLQGVTLIRNMTTSPAESGEVPEIK